MPMSRTRNEPLKLKSEIEIAAAIEDVRGNVAFSGTIKYLLRFTANGIRRRAGSNMRRSRLMVEPDLSET
jgi:hypothetical protein